MDLASSPVAMTTPPVILMLQQVAVMVRAPIRGVLTMPHAITNLLQVATTEAAPFQVAPRHSLAITLPMQVVMMAVAFI